MKNNTPKNLISTRNFILPFSDKIKISAVVLRTITIISLLLISNQSYAAIYPDVIEGTCGESCDGLIRIVAEGTAGPFEASIEGQHGLIQNVPNDGTYMLFLFEDLCLGHHTVEVTNAFGCITYIEVDLPIKESDILEEIDSDNTCICPGGYGSLAPVIEGAVEYNWVGPNGFTSSLPALDFLTEIGTYTLTATDENGCEKDFPYSLSNCITENTFEAEVTHSCEGPGTGSINLELIEVQAPIVFFWTYTAPGGNTVDFTEVMNDGLNSSAENLHEGEYCVTFFTNNGCSFYQCWEIIESEGIEGVEGLVNPNTGQISLIYADGNTLGDEYQYNWTGPSEFASEEASFYAPDVGTYNVTVSSEGKPCTKELSLEFYKCGDLWSLAEQDQESTNFPLSAEVNNFGGITSIDLTVSGLTGYSLNFTWLFNGNELNVNTEDIEVSEPGEYCVVMEERYCGVKFKYCIEVCDFSVKFKVTPLPDFCEGVWLAAKVQGNSDFYTYLWSDGSTTNPINAAYNTEYCVTVTDDGGCSINACATIPHEMLTASSGTTDATFGYNNGTINVTVTGGWPPYHYEWSEPGMSGSNPTNLSGRDYTVTVTDECHTEEILEIHVDCVVPEFTVFNCVSAGITPVECNGDLGSISIDEGCITSGSNLPITVEPNYVYQWDNGATSSSIEGLAVGEYCVTILETNSYCSVSSCFEVPSGEESFDITIDVLQGTCYGGNEAILQANVVGASASDQFAYQWFTFDTSGSIGNEQILEGVGAGWYSVRVTNLTTGCEAFTYTLYWSNGSPLNIEGEITPEPNCDESPSTLEVTSVTGGSSNYSYEWTCCSPSQIIGTEEEVTIFESGYYFVTVTDEETGCIGSKHFFVEMSTPMTIEGEVTHTADCADSGQITLTVTGGTEPYSYEWSTGESTNIIDELGVGQYCAEVTDALGCTSDECFIVSVNNFDFYISEITTSNACGDNCNGDIEIMVSPAQTDMTATWSESGLVTYPTDNPNNIFSNLQLCTGEYSVTVTADNGCTLEESFTIEQIPDFVEGEDYEIEVTSYFNTPFFGAAARIYSEHFVSSQNQDIIFDLPDVEVSGIFLNNDGLPFFIVSIPVDYHEEENFDFSFHSYDCTYSGTIPGIADCAEVNIDYSLNQIEDDGLPCGTIDAYSYELSITEVFPPYTVEVSMEEAYDNSQQNYSQSLEYTGSSMIIEGVPPGNPRFKIKDNCGNSKNVFGNYYGAIGYGNCCGFTCESSVTFGDGGGTADGGAIQHHIPGFTLTAADLCHDTTCFGLPDGVCSNLSISHSGGNNPLNCWEGHIYFEFVPGDEDESPASDFATYLRLDGTTGHIQGYDYWEPEEPGDYIMNVRYEGINDFEGEDCDLSLLFSWYDENYSADVIGFNNELWFDPESVIGFDDYPESFEGAYFGAWKCENCGGTPFIYENDQEECESFGNWEFTYFLFTPDSYDSDNPCNSSGTMTIMGYDANGYPNVFDVQVGPNQSTGSFPGQQPFGLPTSQYCLQSGWCLFNALDVYTGSVLPGNISLIASWSNPETCETWPSPNDPDAEPNCDSADDCPLGYECIDNQCYELCVDGDCFSGECQLYQGFYVCLESTTCQPPCPPGDFTCFEGECYVDQPICNFHESVDGGGGDTWSFLHSQPVGSTIQMTYNTLTRLDRIEVEGATLNEPIPCVATEGDASATLTVTNPEVITVSVIPCEPGSRYDLSLDCLPGLVSDDSGLRNTSPSEDAVKKASEIQVSIYPNPFEDEFELELISAKDGNVKIEICDLFGGSVIKETVIADEGKNRFNYSLDLPAGVYFIIATDENGNIATERVVKAK